MFKFEVYVSNETSHVSNLIETFKDEDVMVAFDAANKWIHKEYQNEDSPNYCIVSQFGCIHI